MICEQQHGRNLFTHPKICEVQKLTMKICGVFMTWCIQCFELESQAPLPALFVHNMVLTTEERSICSFGSFPYIRFALTTDWTNNSFVLWTKCIKQPIFRGILACFNETEAKNRNDPTKSICPDFLPVLQDSFENRCRNFPSSSFPVSVSLHAAGVIMRISPAGHYMPINDRSSN